MNSAIHILNSSALSQKMLEHIAGTVTAAFNAPVMIERSSIDVARSYDNSRGQYHSTTVISQILSSHDTKNEKWIIIVDVDLFIPVLTFVFGEAQFNSSAAVVSTHRLENKFYGVTDDEELFLQRITKEVIHELGHTFGLYHCHQFECVMRSSTYVGEIDLKLHTLCQSCKTLLYQHARSRETQSI